MKYQTYDTFEYKLYECGGLSLTAVINRMNEFGKEGWEVIRTYGNSTYPNINITSFLLKRKIINIEA